MARVKKVSIVDQLMNEHVALRGAPQVVVTRGWAYAFYAHRCGMPIATGKFDSADFAAFGPPAVDAPLSDLNEPWVSSLIDAVASM